MSYTDARHGVLCEDNKMFCEITLYQLMWLEQVFHIPNLRLPRIAQWFVVRAAKPWYYSMMSLTVILTHASGCSKPVTVSETIVTNG